MQRPSSDWPEPDGDEAGADRGAEAVSVGWDIGSYVRQKMGYMRGVTRDAVLVWKLAHTRARCRANQSAASRTSLGTRL
jgi:hypothetical protein